jgi:ABC-type glycerol-3-phosphate transport system permease component
MPYKRIIISIFLSMIFLFPLYMIFINSFKFELDIIKNPAALPDIFKQAK